MEYPTYLIHYGTLGQKWGIRKYQNEDGTWTEEGLRRRRKYVSDSGDLTRSGKKYLKKLQKEKDKTQNLFSRNSGTLVYLQNSYAFESESEREYNDRWFKKVFNETVKNIEYSKVIDSELSAIGQKYLAKAKGFDKSIDDIYVETNKNGEKTIKFKQDVENKVDKADKVDKVDKEDYFNEKYLDNLQSDIDWAKENRDFREELLNEVYPKLENVIKNVDLIETTSKIGWMKEEEANNFFKNNKRISDATDIAMKAAGNEWIKNNIGYHDKPTKLAFLQESMNYPDESKSSGMVHIADLANRGYTKDQIKNIIKASEMITYNFDKRPDGTEIPNKYSLSDISLYPPREKFIDECIKVAKENTLSDSKQSQIKALVASGKSQAEIAKMLGVSTSIVNKYK